MVFSSEQGSCSALNLVFVRNHHAQLCLAPTWDAHTVTHTRQVQDGNGGNVRRACGRLLAAQISDHTGPSHFPELLMLHTHTPSSKMGSVFLTSRLPFQGAVPSHARQAHVRPDWLHIRSIGLHRALIVPLLCLAACSLCVLLDCRLKSSATGNFPAEVPAKAWQVCPTALQQRTVTAAVRMARQTLPELLTAHLLPAPQLQMLLAHSCRTEPCHMGPAPPEATPAAVRLPAAAPAAVTARRMTQRHLQGMGWMHCARRTSQNPSQPASTGWKGL